MHLGFHGGKCCGVKTIYGFSPYPDDKVFQVYYVDDVVACDKDSNGDKVSSVDRFFHASAPQETGLERLDRYLRYCDQRRPGGAIEITLADYSYMPSFTASWGPVLEERGFTVTAAFTNSNSGNKVTIYHRVKSANNYEQPDFDDFVAEWDEAEGITQEQKEKQPELCSCGCGMPLED